MAKKKSDAPKGKEKGARGAGRLDIDAMLEELELYDEFDKKTKKNKPLREQQTKKREKGAKQDTAASSKKIPAPKAQKKPAGRHDDSSEKKLRIIPLGGLGEIGKNMTVVEFDNDIVIIDCGLGFPEEDMFGIDLVIPDFSYLEVNREKIRGVLLTHGHEDHIGAIPYFLRRFNVPVYGTALTIGIIRNKLPEHKLGFQPKLNVVKAGDKVRLGTFEAEFIHVNHSIADACAIALSTPRGVVVHTGDFKLDVSPIEGEMMDLVRLGELGKKGVKLLMCESTNAERGGFTPSEKKVGAALENVFSTNQDKRIVVATFSSNVHRVQQIIDLSVRHGRRVAVTGRSMQSIVSAAIELGYMKPPAGTMMDISEVKNASPSSVTLITTGSQGEPMSALYRMAFGDHAQVSLTSRDVVVLSSSTIPGNEKYIGRIINEFAHNGIKVIYDGILDGVHASGHACAEELKLMMQLVKPKYYMPIHGEHRHLNANSELAESMGIQPQNIFIAELGNVIEIGKRSAAIKETVAAGRTLIDGYGVGDVGNAVLRDRKHLSEDGIVIVFAAVELTSRLIISPPEIVSKGFVYMPDSEELIYDAKIAAADVLADSLEYKRGKPDLETIKEKVRREVAKLLTSRTGRNPIVIPIISDL
jgi:ribonuclease J